jgi:ribosomal protein S13
VNWTEFGCLALALVSVYGLGHHVGIGVGFKRARRMQSKAAREDARNRNRATETAFDMRFSNLTQEQVDALRTEVQRMIDNREIRLEAGLEPGNK